MAIWRNLLGIVTGAGYRQEGIQAGKPGYYSSEAATPVTLDSALQLSTVWACTKIIAETIGSLDIVLYKKNPQTGVRSILVDHPLVRLFSNKINMWQTRQEYFETITYQMALMGNNYSVVQRDKAGNIIGLIPLMSEQMEVALQGDGQIIYKYTDGKNINAYSQKTIWHNKIFGNGIIGLSPLSYARNSLGIAQANENTVSKINRNGGKPSGVLTIDKVLTPTHREAVKKNFSELAEGTQDRLFVLEAGMKYQQVSLSPQDIELLASRRFQIEDICRFFGVPSVLVNDTAASTSWGSGIEQIIQGFYKFGLRPYLERYESSMKVHLLSPEERQTIDIEFDLNDLLQPSLAERIKTYREAVQGGLMTPNQARAEEGWLPIDGAGTLFMQQQMWPIEKLSDPNRVETSGGTKNENTM